MTWVTSSPAGQDSSEKHIVQSSGLSNKSRQIWTSSFAQGVRWRCSWGSCWEWSWLWVQIRRPCHCIVWCIYAIQSQWWDWVRHHIQTRLQLCKCSNPSSQIRESHHMPFKCLWVTCHSAWHNRLLSAKLSCTKWLYVILSSPQHRPNGLACHWPSWALQLCSQCWDPGLLRALTWSDSLLLVKVMVFEKRGHQCFCRRFL